MPNAKLDPPVVGKSYPYQIKYGTVTISAVHGQDPKTGLWDVDVILSHRSFDPEDGTVYGSPPGPPG
jgi:hypothetical protein